ncbi:hypothetical protein PACTADRAFT_50690 [Pachysolen tannophilus NRRL Y-2460]|uniref:Trafficking protein particle complex subunit n=1 Tax=Pachysolen tannophilus NRRL Y-2460 TaxID=669874 RepID=A0A1E4TSY3_PACTA|nr:hypothetical protein PACTADRAFT_50690 [Pachysolen tannophilus NRRL Y-2460]
MSSKIYFVSLISKDNRPLYIQHFFPYESLDNSIDRQIDEETGVESENPVDKKKSVSEDDETSTVQDYLAKQEGIENDLSLLDGKSSSNELLKYNFLSHMALDIFESPFYDSEENTNKNLLFIQDGIAVYGYATSTGFKVVLGSSAKENISDVLYPLFRQIHRTYIKLISNPFYQQYQLEDKTGNKNGGLDEGGIDNLKFSESIKRIVTDWNSS